MNQIECIERALALFNESENNEIPVCLVRHVKQIDSTFDLSKIFMNQNYFYEEFNYDIVITTVSNLIAYANLYIANEAAFSIYELLLEDYFANYRNMAVIRQVPQNIFNILESKLVLTLDKQLKIPNGRKSLLNYKHSAVIIENYLKGSVDKYLFLRQSIPYVIQVDNTQNFDHLCENVFNFQFSHGIVWHLLGLKHVIIYSSSKYSLLVLDDEFQ